MSDPDELARAPCYKCKGNKMLRHEPCEGTGKITQPCPPAAHNTISFCWVCGNAGVIEMTCHGCSHGQVPCDVCGGTG
jgi:hypothetical protein